MNYQLLVLLLLTVGAQPVFAASSESLLPLDDTTLYCNVGYDCIRTRRVLGRLGLGQTEAVGVVTWQPGCPKTTRYYTWTSTEGLLLHATEETWFDSGSICVYDVPRTVLPADVEVGQSWTNEFVRTCEGYPSPKQRQIVEHVSVEAYEMVTVPYGTFAAYKVRSILPDETWDIWYAEGVGPIKYVHDSGMRHKETVLASQCENGVALERLNWGYLKARF